MVESEAVVDPAALQRDLASMPAIWHGMEHDLLRLGVSCLAALRGLDPGELTARYCANEGRPADDFLLAVFEALVAFAETGRARPWWVFMRARIAHRKG